MEAMILVVTLGGPTMFARHRRHEGIEPKRTFKPSRKDTHWGRRKLKQDTLWTSTTVPTGPKWISMT